MDSITLDTPGMMTDSVSDADRLEVATTAPCYLLGIAAELRNGIYELAFTANETEVDLLHSKPPSSAFLRCCKQIGEEATGIFEASVRHYYETKHFHLALEKDKAPITKLDQVAEHFDMQSMKHLQLNYTMLQKVLTYTIDTARSMWHIQHPGNDTPLYRKI